jgi:hypothetical protein
LNSANRLVAVATTIDTVTAIGHVFLVLDPRPFGLVPERGRRPNPRERAAARPPYQSPRNGWNRSRPVDDDELDEQAALEAARREQQREPADLFRHAA